MKTLETSKKFESEQWQEIINQKEIEQDIRLDIKNQNDEELLRMAKAIIIQLENKNFGEEILAEINTLLQSYAKADHIDKQHICRTIINRVAKFLEIDTKMEYSGYETRLNMPKKIDPSDENSSNGSGDTEFTLIFDESNAEDLEKEIEIDRKSGKLTMMNYDRVMEKEKVDKLVAMQNSIRNYREYNHELKNCFSAGLLAIECAYNSLSTQIGEEKMAIEKKIFDEKISYAKKLLCLGPEKFAMLGESKSVVDCGEIVDSQVELFRDYLQGENISIKIINDNKFYLRNASPHKLRVVISNLIKNAEEAFAGIEKPDKKIILLFDYHNGYNCLKIVDNGVGISEVQKHMIMQTDYSSKGDGRGIGMSIVKKYIEELGGKLEVQSAKEKYTEMCLKFPESICISKNCQRKD